MKKLFLSLILSVFCLSCLFSQTEIKNVPFVQRGSTTLLMDIYQPEELLPNTPCIIFLFGGGFTGGDRDEQRYIDYCQKMAKNGYVVATIDYRLGLKDAKSPSKLNTKPLRNAILLAVEDLCAASSFLVENAHKYSIDPAKIIACGSSSGAISVLQADYWLANGKKEICDLLPADFRFAGIISFAGAIVSLEGKPDYKKSKPSPTLFFHGTNDKLVFYDKVQIFNLGFFGTKSLLKRFEKYDVPYVAYRYRDLGHELAVYPMKDNISEISNFIERCVINGEKLKIDMLIKDPSIEPSKTMAQDPKDLYK